jgi:hypothetical protein
MSVRCPLNPSKQTSPEHIGMSALCQKETLLRAVLSISGSFYVLSNSGLVSLPIFAAIRRASSASRMYRRPRHKTAKPLFKCDFGAFGTAPISCGIKFLSAPSPVRPHVLLSAPGVCPTGWLGILSPNFRPISTRAGQASKTALPVLDRFGHWIAGHIPPPVESTRGLAHFDCASALIDRRYGSTQKTSWHG